MQDSSDSGFCCPYCGSELHVVTYKLPRDAGIGFQGMCPRCDVCPPPEDVMTPEDLREGKRDKSAP